MTTLLLTSDEADSRTCPALSSRALTRSNSPLTPAALDLDDASVSSTLSIIGRGAVAKSASVRAPWAKLHGRIAGHLSPGIDSFIRTARCAPNCKDRANTTGRLPASTRATSNEQQESCHDHAAGRRRGRPPAPPGIENGRTAARRRGPRGTPDERKIEATRVTLSWLSGSMETSQGPRQVHPGRQR